MVNHRAAQNPLKLSVGKILRSHKTAREKKIRSILSESFLLSMILSQTCLTTFLAARVRVKCFLKFIFFVEAIIKSKDYVSNLSLVWKPV